MPVFKITNQTGSTSRKNNKDNSQAKGGRGSKDGRSSLQTAAQGGQTTLRKSTNVTPQELFTDPTDSTRKSRYPQLPSAVSYATAASTSLSSTSLSSAAYSVMKSKEMTNPTGDQGGAKSGKGEIARLTSQEDIPQGEDDNKRRDRSRSPLPATSTRPQHSQEIRTVMMGQKPLTREGPVIKYQGSGSPMRKGADVDGDEDK